MDDPNFVSGLRVEEERLLGELQSHPTYRKLEQVRALIALYDPSRTTMTRAPSAPSRRAPPPRQRSPQSIAIENAVAEHLRGMGQRQTAGQLFKGVVEPKKLPVGGKDKLRSFSSFLSSSKVFLNVPGEGYGLAEWGTEPRPKGISYQDIRDSGHWPANARGIHEDDKGPGAGASEPLSKN